MNFKRTFYIFLTICYGIHLFASDQKEININEITIVSNKLQLASESLHIITTLNRQEIASLPAQNINDLLDYLPGIDIRQRGGNGLQADVSMRGGSFDQVLIMLNGVNIIDVQTGHHNLDIPIDIDIIDRIEILQGTSLQLFGLSAFSGAINIITGKQSEIPLEINVSMIAGQYGLYHPALNGKFSTRKWTYLSSYNYNASNGYMYNTDYKYENLFVQANGMNTLSGTWNIQLGCQLKEFGANSFYSLKYPNQFEATKTLLGSIHWEKNWGKLKMEAGASYRTHYDRFELIRNMENAPNWYTGHNYHITQNMSGHIKGNYFSSIGKTSIGVEMRDENIVSNVLGDSIKTIRPIPFTKDSLFFLYTKTRLNFNYYAEQSVYIGKWTASIGLSGNYNSMFNNNICFGMNVGYNFTKNGNIYTNINRAIRLPTFTDLYYQSATQIANPNLQPESSFTTEIGMKWQKSGFQMQINGYYRRGKNIIDWVKNVDEEKWHSVNHTQINAIGGEACINYHYGYWLKNANISYSFCHLNKKSETWLSKYALDYLKHKFTCALEHGIYKGFGGSWQISFQQREGSYINIDGEMEIYQPFWLIDGRIYWKNNKINIFIEGNNLTNRHYSDYGGILQAGRWIKTGIKVNI